MVAWLIVSFLQGATLGNYSDKYSFGWYTLFDGGRFQKWVYNYSTKILKLTSVMFYFYFLLGRLGL